MFLSIIIPTRNRAERLAAVLQSIIEQDYPGEKFEVIVVDNGSTDDTKEIVENYAGSFKGLRYCYAPSPGLHIGRHRGLAEARGAILVYADDDIEAFPTWLQSIAEAFEDEKTVLAGGKILPKYESDPPKWLLRMWEKEQPEGRFLIQLSILDLGDKIREISPYFVFGCNYAIRKSVLLEAGGFHPDAMPPELIKFRGDGETAVSGYIQAKGYKALYHPEAAVYHLVSKRRMTETYFLRNSFNQGVSASYAYMRTRAWTGHRRVFWVRMEMLLAALARQDLKYRLLRSYIQGFQFHQREFRDDQSLRDWVRMENYIGRTGEVHK